MILEFTSTIHLWMAMVPETQLSDFMCVSDALKKCLIYFSFWVYKMVIFCSGNHSPSFPELHSDARHQCDDSILNCPSNGWRQCKFCFFIHFILNLFSNKFSFHITILFNLTLAKMCIEFEVIIFLRLHSNSIDLILYLFRETKHELYRLFFL